VLIYRQRKPKPNRQRIIGNEQLVNFQQERYGKYY